MRKLFLWGLLLQIGLGCFLVAIIFPGPRSGIDEYFALGLLFGTMYSHATLASAWAALGPLSLIWRLPLSVSWLAAILIAFAVNVSVHRGPAEAWLVIGGSLVGQYLVTQFPIWGLAIGYGLRVRRRDEQAALARRESQFGIRQLMVVTAIVAIVLGIGRAIVLRMVHAFPDKFGGEPMLFVFLGAAGILTTLPLVLAALLSRYAVLASMVILLLISIWTLIELPLMRTLVTGPGPGPDIWHFALINGFQALWVLVLVGTLRLGGYTLFVARRNLRNAQAEERNGF